MIQDLKWFRPTKIALSGASQQMSGRGLHTVMSQETMNWEKLSLAWQAFSYFNTFNK